MPKNAVYLSDDRAAEMLKSPECRIERRIAERHTAMKARIRLVGKLLENVSVSGWLMGDPNIPICAYSEDDNHEQKEVFRQIQK